MMKTLLQFVTVLGLFLPMSTPDGSGALPEDTLGGNVGNEDNVVLITSTNDPSEDILNIELYKAGVLKLTITGCGSNYCRDGISSLGTGTYQVIVTTDAGSFSGTIIKT
ncbi:hypothetical protein [Phaeodactylibacter sp.]|uniref:hypothetical protein n=1 Tax=Phaeodactylibacter sp. TaxID=1940289 RepID=UPI0025D78C2E|nr:hypothetical protein [Phaeodactylibacter sp.]MCI4648996.1 hypothetical protein [Phaeodactylibacter sp.]MCI5093585.1 hypothetical protein [Phaeodactylibacter sp.]